MGKKKVITKDELVRLYIDYVLDNNHPPRTIYTFAKANNLEESDIYNHFGSFTGIETTIFSMFFTKTLNVLESSDDYNSYDTRTKLISFYFTFFEQLNANRSFVVYSLDEQKDKLKGLRTLKGLRSHFLNYIDQLNIPVRDLKQKTLDELKDRAVNETYWIQLMMTLRFWLDDSSPNFEKTDIFIEKSIHASFDLIEITPLKSVVDFGKFLFKEKVSMN